MPTLYLNEEKLREKIDWKPHKAQEEILKHLKRFNVICAGVRFGKTQLAAYLCLREVLQSEKHIWVVAPTYGLAKRTFDYTVNWIAKAFPSAFDVSVARLRIVNPAFNSWIEFKSAEVPHQLLGEEIDLVIIDEASRVRKVIWEDYIYARLTSRQGKAVFISTPFGKNWFYEEFIKAKEDPKSAAFHFESRDNPYFPPEEWELAKKRLPERIFKQNYKAEFLDDAASVFRNIKQVIRSDSLQDAQAGHQYILGVDLGRHEDFTVLTVVDKASHRVVYIDRFKEIDYVFQKKRILAIAERYNHARVVIDVSNIGDPIAEDLRREGLIVDAFKFSGPHKKELIEKLAIYIEQGRITIPPKEFLIDELEAFSYELTPSGQVKYSAPEGMHDDSVISLALAVWPLGAKPTELSPIKQEIYKRKRSRQTRYEYI